MTRSKKSLLVCFAGVLALALAVLLVSGLFVSVDRQYKDGVADAYLSGYEQGKQDAVPIQELVEANMPLYLQTDPAWSDHSYGAGTIGSHGCGLTCSAMAATYLTGSTITPDQMADASGDAFITNGMNDPAKICYWMQYAYDLQYSGEKKTIDECIDLLDHGYLVIAGLSGNFGDRYYYGHDVLIYAKTDSGYLVRDPDDGDNSVRLFSEEELRQVSWIAFNGVKHKTTNS